MKKSTDNELSRMYSEDEVKQRFTIGVAVGIMFTVFIMLMLLVAYHTRPQPSPQVIIDSSNPVHIKTHDDSLADSCGKAIMEKQNRHRIKTIEEK